MLSLPACSTIDDLFLLSSVGAPTADDRKRGRKRREGIGAATGGWTEGAGRGRKQEARGGGGGTRTITGEEWGEKKNSRERRRRGSRGIRRAANEEGGTPGGA